MRSSWRRAVGRLQSERIGERLATAWFVAHSGSGWRWHFRRPMLRDSLVTTRVVATSDCFLAMVCSSPADRHCVLKKWRPLLIQRPTKRRPPQSQLRACRPSHFLTIQLLIGDKMCSHHFIILLQCYLIIQVFSSEINLYNSNLFHLILFYFSQ